MIDEKIARVKALIQKREEIDAELAAIFGMSAPSKRGRPRKEQGNGGEPEQRPAPESTGPSAAGA